MEKIKQIGEKITFWKILSQNQIVIPKIQRDYAQGREDVKVEIIRNEILNNLFDVLNNEQQTLNLDFVYGSDDNGKIIPLDGQQRLTTLFLLHFYLARISGDYSEENKSVLMNFKYEIRSSTQKFITALLQKEISFETDSIADEVENQPWFFHSWKKDPTVKAMLVMLDAIHNKFKGKTEFWKKLILTQDITFYFLALNDFKLTDELYVKMNSRGKPLSDFENFKSWLDEELGKLLSEDFKKQWSLKLDTVWTDLFWNSDDGDNSIDEEIMNFFRGMAFFNYIENFRGSTKSEEFKFKTAVFNNLNAYISNKEYQSFLFHFQNDQDCAVFENITSFLDFYSNDVTTSKVNDLLKEVNFWEDAKEGSADLFLRFLNRPDFKSRTLFYGLFHYMISHDGHIADLEFKRKFRILRNLVENTEINTDNIKNVLLSVKKLMQSTDVIGEINSLDLAGFYGNQINEEKLKATWISAEPHAEEIFTEAENIHFFKGRLEFAFFCSDASADNMKLSEFTAVKDILKENFNKTNFSNDIRRAMFTIRENNFYDYWLSWSHTTNTHKRCLIEDTRDLKKYFVYGGWRYYLKDLILKIREKPLPEILSTYQIPSDMPVWKARLIKEPQLIDKYCDSYYFGFENNHKFCYLFKDKKRPSSVDFCKKIA